MRLIDADALIERLKKDSPQTSKLKWAQIVADNAPTIDAEPVVRCIDCIFWYDCEYPFKSEKGFCCCGEREEE